MAESEAGSPSAAPHVPLRRLRVARRALLAAAATLCLFLLWAGVQPLLALAPRLRRRWRTWIFRSWGRAVCAACGVRLVVSGAPLPHGVFLVCNHLSFVDIWVLAATTGGRFVSMAEVASWPGIGFMAARIGTIFIRRQQRRDIPKVNAQIAAALAAGDTVLVFPEGGNSQGATVRTFKPSLLEPAAAGGHPVAWATLRYDTRDPRAPAAWAVCWVRNGFGAQLARILSLPGVEAQIRFGEGVERAADRRVLAERLQARVAEAFVPLAQPPDEHKEAPIEHGLAARAALERDEAEGA